LLQDELLVAVFCVCGGKALIASLIPGDLE
jgi:hypothetical protein